MAKSKKDKKTVKFQTFGPMEKALVSLLLLGSIIISGFVLWTSYERIIGRMVRRELIESGQEVKGRLSKKDGDSYARQGQGGQDYVYKLHVFYKVGQTTLSKTIVVSEDVFDRYSNGDTVKVYISTTSPDQVGYEFLPREIETPGIIVGGGVGLLALGVAALLLRFVVRSYWGPNQGNRSTEIPKANVNEQ